MIKNRKTFCILPWVHTHVNTEGDVYPCCVSWNSERSARVGWLKDSSLEDLFNSDFMKQLRLDMLNGVDRPDVCQNCYDREEAGFDSARIGNNKDFAKDIDSLIEKTQPEGYLDPIIKSWDIRFSNLCNLKCRSCGPLFSTTWAQESKEMDVIKIHPYKDDADPLEKQYDNVEKIYFAGGEPLIMPEHFRTLQTLIDKGRSEKIHLVYNSNLTKLDYNNNDLLGYWKHFKKVVIGASIDAVGSRAEYIRHGVPWKTIESNLSRLVEFKNQTNNFDFYFSPTVGVLNAWHITDMHKYLWEKNLMSNIDSIMFNMLLYPKYYDCRILSKDLKDQISEKIQNHIEWIKNNNGTDRSISQFDNLKSYLYQEFDDHAKDMFVLKTSYYDKIRNESFVDTFPEYAEWYGKINV